MHSPYVIVVPARGGSERVPRKNLVLLGGKPLLQYTLDSIRAAGVAEMAIVSTDDPHIRSCAESSGFRVLERPAHLAGSTTNTEAVLLHTLDHLAKEEWTPEWVVTLPPTNPFRTVKTIHSFIEATQQASNIDAIFSVTERAEDFWIEERSGALRRVFPEAPRSQQQRMARGEILFEENGAVYATRVNALRKGCAKNNLAPILGERRMALAIPKREGMDINEKQDIEIAEALLRLSPLHD